MKRVQMFLAGAFIAVGSLCAQSTDAEWQAEVAKLKETIQTNPAQAAEEAEHLIKGKNKKNVELLVAIGNTYLDADKLPEAQEYATLARKANGKSALASVLEGNIAMKQKNAGLASQKYEEAIYFDPKCTEAYLKYADVYKSANASLAIEKLNQLKALEPSNTAVDKKLAEIYYLKNDFSKAAEAYANFAMGPTATEEDLVKYAFLGAKKVWQEKARLLSSICSKVVFSDKLEQCATDEQREKGLDIVDFLLMEDTPMMTLQKMIKRCPSLQTLIDQFQLELVEQ